MHLQWGKFAVLQWGSAKVRWVQAKFQSCCKTLNAYCRNVYMSIADDSKRRINLDNKAFRERVAALPGGVDFLNQVGFHVRPPAAPCACRERLRACGY
jgi:hypothetical protein